MSTEQAEIIKEVKVVKPNFSEFKGDPKSFVEPGLEKFKEVVEITLYRTVDGKVFESLEEAQLHARTLQFRNWYDENELFVRGDIRVTFEELIEWLDENWIHVKEFMKNRLG